MTLPLPTLTCGDCGGCCESQGTPPMMTDEFDALPAWLKWDREAHATRYDKGLPCLWYDADAMACRYYGYRPQVCRDFPLGGPTCRQFRTDKGLPVWDPSLDIEED